MVWADGTLYVAATDAILAYPYQLGQDKITAEPRVLTPLPGGPIDHHWTKDLALSPDGKSLYASVGSNSNITENGLEAEKGRAAIWQVDRATGAARVFASGLRNPNGLSFEPETGDALGGGQRARRARAEPGAGLHDLGEGRRVLRLAMELLRVACRSAGPSAAAGHGGRGDTAGLCAVEPRGAARDGLLDGLGDAGAVSTTAPSSASTAAGTAATTTATR